MESEGEGLVVERMMTCRSESEKGMGTTLVTVREVCIVVVE